MQMHRKSGGHNIHPENSEKLIEGAGIHNPLPHLYNLQGKSRLKICSLQVADMEENETIMTLAKGNKPKDEPKIGKANNQKGAKRVCRASKYLPNGDRGHTTRQ